MQPGEGSSPSGISMGGHGPFISLPLFLITRVDIRRGLLKFLTRISMISSRKSLSL